MELRVDTVVMVVALVVLMATHPASGLNVTIASRIRVSSTVRSSGTNVTGVFLASNIGGIETPGPDTPTWDGAVGAAYATEVTVTNNSTYVLVGSSNKGWTAPRAQFTVSKGATVSGCIGIFGEGFVNALSQSAAYYPPACSSDLKAENGAPLSQSFAVTSDGVQPSFEVRLAWSPPAEALIRTAAMQNKKLYYVVMVKPGSSNAQVLMTDLFGVTFVSSPQPPAPPPPVNGAQSAHLISSTAALLPVIASVLLVLFVL